MPNNTSPKATDASISIDPNTPVILCDADEVLVYFVRPFEAHLATCGYFLDLSSYNLFGNIRDLNSSTPADKMTCKSLLTSFFDDCIDQCTPVSGAVDALNNLSAHAQIIVLSNVPANSREGREKSLALQGMPYPVIANEGPKGPAVRNLLQKHKSSAYFIDDIASHHQSVLKHAPQVRRVHFVADPRLAKLIDAAEHAHTRIDNWEEIETFIMNDLIGPTTSLTK